MDSLNGKICKVYDQPLLSGVSSTNVKWCELETFQVFREPVKKPRKPSSEGRVWRVHYTDGNITYMKHFPTEELAIIAQDEAVMFNGFLGID